MEIKEYLSILAIILSLTSLLWNIVNSYKSKHKSNLVSNLSAISAVEAKLGELPKALRFHGISENDLKKANVTAEEFSYLLSSLTVGGLYHRQHKKNEKTFANGTYRNLMCQSKDFRAAWPLLKTMLSPSPYRDRIDATVEFFNNNQ